MTRYVDGEKGRMFYANENGHDQNVVFYIHGGAYIIDINSQHWQIIETLINRTNSLVIAPAYRLAPFGTYKEAFELILPVYKEYCTKYPNSKIIMMGDSAGAGLAVALTEYCKMEGIRRPDELVLISPWIDAVMDNKEIKNYESRDPALSVPYLKVCAKRWAGGLDLHDWRISPIYGDLKGISHVTVFTGTSEVFYPDIIKFFNMLDDSHTNELIIGEELFHIYPLFPIKEAKQAQEKIIEKILR